MSTPYHKLRDLFKLASKRMALITLIVFSFLLISLPGQNKFQTLFLSPSAPKVRGLEITLPVPGLIPIPIENIKYPHLSAKAAIVIDAASGSVLFAKNPDSKLSPASTTKIMTALVTLDVFDLEKVITINNADQSIGHTSDLESGEKITVENLLYAMLVSSGNDAALALAQNHQKGYQDFVRLMNQKAKQFNLNNTKYQNVSGVEQLNHYTSVRDLALLTKEAMKNDVFVNIVSTNTKTITSTDGSIIHNLENINTLLGVIPGLRGVKTGWTQLAGECLVADTVRDGHQIITVVLGSQDRFGETSNLIEWVYSNHTWINPG